MKWSTYHLLHVYNNAGDLVRKPINLNFSKKLGICHEGGIKNAPSMKEEFLTMKEDKHTLSLLE